jgi:DNA-binding response OmpR family regulator
MKTRILVVDDDDMFRDAFVEFLECEGFRSHQAQNGECFAFYRTAK